MIGSFAMLFLACVSDDAEDLPTPGDSMPSEPAGGRPELPFPPDAGDSDPAPGAVHVTLSAEVGGQVVGGETLAGYAYNGASPGPVIRATLGDAVVVDLRNTLPDPTTLHWHGMAVPNAMDGVEWLQSPVPSMAGFTYSFTANEAGTFWYHPHVDTARQVDLGLYGLIVVADPAEPAADRDVALVFDAWDEAESGDFAADDHTPPDPRTVRWTVNGAESPVWTLEPGERVRARLLNASNTSYLALSWPGARLIGGEQGLLAAEALVEGLVLAPGDRAEVEVAAGAAAVEVSTAPWSASGGEALGEDRTLFTVSGAEGALAVPLPFEFSGALPSPDPGTTDLLYTFAGGAPDTDWLINGESWPDVTVRHVPLDADVVVELHNLSATHHPFHLHGHRVEVLSIDGIPPAVARWEDTIDVAIRSVVRLRLPATNPGRWALHCHLLGHEQGGMMTELDVDAP